MMGFGNHTDIETARVGLLFAPAVADEITRTTNPALTPMSPLETWFFKTFYEIEGTTPATEAALRYFGFTALSIVGAGMGRGASLVLASGLDFLEQAFVRVSPALLRNLATIGVVSVAVPVTAAENSETGTETVDTLDVTFMVDPKEINVDCPTVSAR